MKKAGVSMEGGYGSDVSMLLSFVVEFFLKEQESRSSCRLRIQTTAERKEASDN